PSPTINRAPSYAVTDCADAGNAKATSKPRATTTATAATFTRCMGTSSMKYTLQLQSELRPLLRRLSSSSNRRSRIFCNILNQLRLVKFIGDKHRLKRSIGRQLWLFPLGVAESQANLIELDNLISYAREED